MNKIIFKILIGLIILLNSSCASVLNSKYQKVKVHTPSSDSKVYVNNKYQGKGSTVVSKMKRNHGEKQIRIERPGYKNIYDVHYQDRKSPLYIMSWIPFGITFYAPLLDYGAKSYDYKRDFNIIEKPIKVTKRDDNTKYLFLKNTSFDVKKDDLKFKRRKKRKYDKNKEKFKNERSSEKDVNYDNTIFSNSLNEILVDNNFSDSTSTLFKKKTNTAYISATVKKIDFEEVYETAARGYKSFVYASVEIEWSVYDLYDQLKHKKLIKSESGKFSDWEGVSKIITGSIKDAITYSFYKFLNLNEVKEELKIAEGEVETFEDYISVKSTRSVGNLEEAINATVTLKVDKGHGSGCVVSNDGYILTNFHVVSGNNKKIEVLTAKLIRKSEELDLALLKVEDNFKITYTIPTKKNYSIGQDVFAIGTPGNIDLGQTLSKGIISGFRNRENLNFIQTDASVNPGNSGGALVNKKGELIGIVNSKILGLGVEGLAFAIPAENIKKFLYLK